MVYRIQTIDCLLAVCLDTSVSLCCKKPTQVTTDVAKSIFDFRHIWKAFDVIPMFCRYRPSKRKREEKPEDRGAASQ